ncbi:hypothetical protein [Clostridium minihomine]|uniref:hypothetical protein n=1 Tax=Clostridium minihomine TaxID=2045012 RepID=UPI0013EA5703|nr:hypothetical protein [Clostridium minihomine]
MSGLKLIYTIWRLYDMYNETKGFVKGISAGLVAGLAVASVSNKAFKNNRQLKRSANKAMKKVGGVLDNMEYMFK